MPYKSPEAQRESQKKYRERQKDNAVIPDTNVIPPLSLASRDNARVKDSVIPKTLSQDPPWQHVKEFIQRQEPPSTMPYLDRLQRIAGSLGKHANHVFFGELTMHEIGNTIGILPPGIPRP